jgi:IS30 family transposase
MSGIAMGTQYTHLDLEERCRLRGLMEMKLGIGEIAGRLDCHGATIHQEIEREHCVEGYISDRTVPSVVPGRTSSASPPNSRALA